MLFVDTILWLVPIFGLLLWIPQNAQHEGSHAIAAKIFGAKILSFWPFPSRKLGYFTWAHVRFAYTGQRPSHIKEGVISAAPFLASLIVMLVTTTLVKSGILSPVLNSFLVAWFITSFIDSAYGMSTFYKKDPREGLDPDDDADHIQIHRVIRSDGWKMAHYWGLSRAAGIAIVVCWKVIWLAVLLIPLR